jgi:hypothetical protein
MKKLTTAALFILLAFCTQAQGINLGIGKTSDARTAGIISINDICAGLGAYVKHINQEFDSPPDHLTPGLIAVENDELTAGLTYRIHEQVILFAGLGTNHTINYYNGPNRKRTISKATGNSYEIGAQIQLIKTRFFVFSLAAIMSNNSQLNTLALVGFKL